MAGRADAVLARARALLGTRFRPQGRSIGAGLDCIGLAALALDLPPDAVPRNYALRGFDPARIEAALRQAGLVPVPAAAPGDLVLFVTGPAQIHLAILAEASFIHADAALRKVAERPLPAPWPALGAWRERGTRWPP